MRTYARVQDGVVAELFSTNLDMASLFNPSLLWVEIADAASVAEGWSYDGERFGAPSAPAGATTQTPSISDLHMQIKRLGTQLDALSRQT